MIKKVILFAIIILVQIYATMAQVIPNTQDITLESKVLEEQRELRIHLPKDYTENKSYPVLYITDGETTNFEVAKQFLDVLSDPTFNIIPPCILVGIKQKKREHELRAFGGNNG